MQVSQATVNIVYSGKDITRDIMPDFLGLSYTDKTEGESDEISITVKNDHDKWIDSWLPDKGDKISATIIQGNSQLPCGEFTIDEINPSEDREGGCIAVIKGLSAGVKDGIRTKYSVAHEGKTLKQIAVTIAQKYNYKVVGIINDFTIARVTQFRETDLAFLHRIAMAHGYMFALKGSTLVFTLVSGLTANSTVATLLRNECIPWTVRDKVTGIYHTGRLRHFNSKLKKTYDNLVTAGANPSADVLNSFDKVDSDQEADYKINGRMYRKNLEQTEMDLTTAGNIYLVGGNNVLTSGFKKYDAKWFIGTSTHDVDRAKNYLTRLNLKRVS